MVVVGTQLGKVRGRDLGGVVSFEGIPYAAAPEGALRFRPPAPREPWAGVRDCTVAGTAAPQLPPTPRAPGVWRADDGLDCLNLNVWTPDPAGAGLPVMVWVHGGLWKYGSPRMPQYDGATLARSGVVVVSVGYRLGFEGFGHLPGVPANRGLHDQIAAFEWVRRNIAAFGGDPDAVTAFGQSAGAASVGYLLDTGLFRRAIAQSPPSGVHEPEAARAVTEKIAAAAGVPATLEAFETLPPEALLAVQDAPLTGRDGPTAFGPVADGELVTGPLWTAAAPDVDLVCGFTHEEFRGQGALPQGVGFDAVATAMGHDAAAYRAAYPGFDDSGLFVTLMSDVVYRIPALRAGGGAHARGRAHVDVRLRLEQPRRRCRARRGRAVRVRRRGEWLREAFPRRSTRRRVPRAFRGDPALVDGFRGDRRSRLARVRPHTPPHADLGRRTTCRKRSARPPLTEPLRGAGILPPNPTRHPRRSRFAARE